MLDHVRLWGRTGLLAGFLCGALLIIGLPAPAVAGSRRAVRAGQAAAIKVTARAAYLTDLTTGETIFQKRPDHRLPIASLTKVMTAYVARHEGGLDDVIMITRRDVRHGGNGASNGGLKAGERFTARDLLYALMLPSAADAAAALARTYGPGRAAFVAKMNAAARRLGLTRTHYVKPDGMPSPPGGYSTARDQTALARVVLHDPVIRVIAHTRRHSVGRTGSHRAHTWSNTNKLLAAQPGALGLKTGYTRAAGFCLMFAADTDGHLLVGTILGETDAHRRLHTATRLLALAA
jgi:D-alanyl-D-alanine carboxypeptidase (penicillin-binding protein 5/6)